MQTWGNQCITQEVLLKDAPLKAVCSACLHNLLREIKKNEAYAMR